MTQCLGRVDSTFRHSRRPGFNPQSGVPSSWL